MTHASIVSMIEELRFDDLHELVSREDTVFSKDDPVRKNLLYKIIRAGVVFRKEMFASIRLLEFLLSDEDHMSSPYWRTQALKASAACGNIFLLQAICSKGLHRLEDFGAILSSSCREADGTVILKWLQNKRKKYFQDVVPERSSIEMAFCDALKNEFVESARFLLENKKELGCEDWTPDKTEFITWAADEGATSALDYFVELWGHDFVVGIITEHMYNHFKETNTWLRRQNKALIRKHLQNAIEKLDTVKQDLQEGDYLTIVNHMQKVYDNA